ncbi:hypothetical protein CUMW_062140 [Citrus unshiu]|uniref:Uncharacterized protein n=1 Tax=Citrus unshiu TaxID=55188 RepID=A0A2H5NP05_CITUN|nr:hypothetical protein CUMW_062140 [Citrus unshiu]
MSTASSSTACSKNPINTVSEKFNAGFELPFVACCGYGDIGYYNYSIKALTLIVEEQSIRPVNWDRTHYAGATNKFVSRKIL